MQEIPLKLGWLPSNPQGKQEQGMRGQRFMGFSPGYDLMYSFVTPRSSEWPGLALDQAEHLCALHPLALWEGSLTIYSGSKYCLSVLMPCSKGGESG